MIARTNLLCLALLAAACILAPQASAQLQQYDLTISVASGGTTGSVDLPATFGDLRAIRSICPNITSTTYTLTLRDENDATVWTKASITENATIWLQPNDDSAWTAGMPPPITSGSRGPTGWDLPSGSAWSVLATTATTEAATRTIPITLYIEESPNP